MHQKPYTNGNEEDYYMELTDRYMHGELSEVDSIKFDDSLKYTTPGGKIVYGGGGIMPDIFTPIDTTGFTNYLMELRNRGLIYRFALQYSDNHRKDLDQLNSLAEFNNYLNRKKAFNQFITFAAENGVPVNKKEIAISEKVLRVQLYAYIIRNTSLDNKGFYPAIESIDNTSFRPSTCWKARKNK
jgi:carboxyl-terminal processing protease